MRRQPKDRVLFLASEGDAVPSAAEIAVSQLSHLLGLPPSSTIIDVRADEAFATDLRLIPGVQRRNFGAVTTWTEDYQGHSVIVVCEQGLQLSPGATPFDYTDAVWADRGDKCTFDVMIEEFGLGSDALTRSALIVRGADVGRPDLTPQPAGLLAASLGYSRMYRDDLAQRDAANATSA